MTPETESPSQQDATVAAQDRYAPTSICYGCGPANQRGLQIKSHWEGDSLEDGTFVLRFTPEEHHQAFPGVINGGILGTLLDCHSNWAAATALMDHNGWDRAQCTVTAYFNVALKRPTPAGKELLVTAKIIEIEGDDRAKVHAEVRAEGSDKVTATCDGLFVAVKEGHPAYHRWG